MKKRTLIYGLIAGAIITAVMVYSTAMCYRHDDYEGSMTLGFTAMIVAFSLIFIGIRQERIANGGWITFGAAFKTGLYIALIASTIYVLVWLVDYYVFMPDFMERYTAYELKQAAAKGKDVAAKSAEMEGYRDLYKNPVMVVLLTYTEVLPIGLIIALLSALILKKKPVQAEA